MAQNFYECMVILDSNKYARDPGGISAQIPDTVTKTGGEVLASRLWNEQKLAYPIGSHRKGTYWLTYFKLDGRKLPDFLHACRLNENIVRQLTLKVDPRIVDHLVAQARGERIPQPAPVDVVSSVVEAEPEEAVDVDGEGKD